MSGPSKTGIWRGWRRWWAAMHFVDVLYKTRRADAHHR